MKYVVLIYSNPATWGALAAEEQDQVINVHNELIDELARSGEFLNIYRLADRSATKTVRHDGGVRVVTDGPFGEAKEVLASLWEIDVETVDRATEIAGPLARYGTVEVTPLMDAAGTEM
ncbi:MAG: YciI family protein [Jiangellaceae bacterium]